MNTRPGARGSGGMAVHASARGAACCILVTLIAAAAHAQEATLGEAPAPDSARGLSGPFAKALEDRVEAEVLFPRWKRRLEQGAPFFRDTRATLRPRMYYFDRRFPDGVRSEAWALGGAIEYQRGWYRDRFSVGFAYYHSDKLLGDEDRGGTLLLAPGQEGFNVLGQAYAAMRYGGHQATLYRQALDLPYVNRQDSRMAPNTFEAYRMEGRLEQAPLAGTLRYGLGYVDKIKRRNADTFVSMSEAAGVEGANRGLVLAGAAVQPDENLLFGAIDHFVDDTLNIFYTEADYHHMPLDGVDIRYQGQFTHQQSVGDDLLTGSDYDTWVLGGRVAASYRGAILKAAFSTTDDGERIRSPYGAYPGYISLMQSDFNLAGMDAWLLGVSYDFRQVGLKGLSIVANYAEGYGARDVDDGSALPDQSELNITGDYRILEGLLRGLWLRVRWSRLDFVGQSQATDNFRVIVNYEIPLL